MKIQKTFVMAAVLLSPLIMGRSQEAGAPNREFNEHVNRQNQVFEHRQQSSPPPVPQQRSPTTTLSQRSGARRRNDR